MDNKNKMKVNCCHRCGKEITNKNGIALTQHAKTPPYPDVHVFLCEKCKKKWFKFIGWKIEW